MVAERLTELWPEIKKIVEFWNHLPQSGRPASESYNAVAVIVTMKVTVKASVSIVIMEVTNIWKKTNFWKLQWKLQWDKNLQNLLRKKLDGW